MKKIFTFIVLFVVSLYSMAQTPFFYEWKNGYCTRRYLSDVDSITFDSNQKPFDSTTYDRLSGAWKMEVVSDYDGPLTFDVTVLTDEEGGSAYGKYCVVTGLSGYEFMTARLDYHFDASTGEGYVAFPMPYVSVEGVNFGSFVGDIHLYGITEDNKVMTGATSIKGIWNDDMSEITFEAAPKMGMVVVVDGQLYGWWDRFVVVKMVKTKMKYNTMNLALSSGNVCSDNSVAITPNEVITTSIKRAETAFMDSSVNNCCPDTFEVASASKDNTKNETKDDVATVNMDKEWRTSTAGAQSQYFYEWKDGKYIQRSVSEIDSITFSLADAPETEYKYVDLGLPSGTLWADRNVGADSPEAYGDYFAWGETSTKSTYDWDTYKWCQSSNTTLTKYCTNSSYGTIDNKTVLDLEDDAAYVNMGLEWRMPTIDELNELNTECTWTWTTQNGTNGYKVTGPNGNSIFLPAAGYRDDSELYVVGSGGVYWSSTLYESNPVSAQYLGFSLSSHSMYGNSRNYGLTVRAVNSTATCKEVGEAPDGKYFVGEVFPPVLLNSLV